MTYPPQQPGQPGPYDQQPGQFGQQPGQFGQQPGQPGQFGQQPGQFGPPGAPPPGPDGGYGYPGGMNEPPPKRKRSGTMIALVIIGAILVLGGGGTGVYFLTKSKDNSSNNSQGGGGGGASSSEPKIKPTGPKGSGSSSSIGGLPFPSGGGDASGSKAPPPSVGGPGGPISGSDADAISDAAKRYAAAVTNKDEAAAKDLTCDKSDGGILYDSGGKVEVTGKPESFGSDSASIDVKVTIGDSEPIDNFPLFMNKKGSGWCVS